MEIKDISLNSITIKDNIRQYPVDNTLPELMTSIRENGLLQPVGVKRNPDGNYTLIWGYRRFLACKKLGHKTIPAVIFIDADEDMTEEQFFIINSTENLQRRDNNLKEFGRICQILRKTMSVSEISARLGVPSSRVQSALSNIKRIPKKWQSRIRLMNGDIEKKGDVPLSTASKIMSFTNLTSQQKDDLLEDVSKNDTGYMQIVYLASLLKTGMNIKEAKNKLNNYKLVTFKALAKKDILENEMKEYQNPVDYFMDTFNKKVKNDKYLIKLSLYEVQKK